MTGAAYERLAADLAAGRTVVIDGGTGTELERRGAAMHGDAWCAMATLEAPETLRAVHEDYVRAGARVITANTYASGRSKLEPAGLGDRVEELNRRSVEIALEARERAGGDDVVVAGSMSHMVPFEPGPGGTTVRHFPPAERLEAHFREVAAIQRDAGAELIILEMMYAPHAVPLAIRAARDTGLPVWVGLSVRRGETGIAAYLDPAIPFADLLEAAVPCGGEAFGVMHSHVDVTGPALASLREVWSGPLMAYPDSGYFEMPNWHFVEIIAPSVLVEAARGWVDAGATILGGCRGLGVEHVEAMAEAFAGR